MAYSSYDILAFNMIGKTATICTPWSIQSWKWHTKLPFKFIYIFISLSSLSFLFVNKATKFWIKLQ